MFIATFILGIQIASILGMKEYSNIMNIGYTSLQKEFVRKSIHMTVAMTPAFASYNRELTVMFLMFGILIYIVSEIFRAKGIALLGILSSVSEIASRERDRGITLGPVTLAMGVIFVLLYFEPVAASCGIYALAFGDGLSSVTGKLWGRVKIPFTQGKSFVGFFTCFVMILSTSYGITSDLKKSLLAAFAGSLTELIPIKDVDNLLIPFVVAFVITVI